ncbi:reverse transcriptase domain-containing protein [Tanacetum coccineum]
MVERQFTTKLKNVQTDWGHEFRNLSVFFSSLGIIHRRSCPHTSEQNGFVECRNRQVVETSFTLLAQACVPQHFCHYAFDIVVYLINRTPSPQFAFDISNITSPPPSKTSPYYFLESPYIIPTTDHPSPSSPRSPISSPSSVSHLSPTSQTSPEHFNGQPSPVSTTSIPPPPPPLPITRQRLANLRQNPRQRVPYNPFANHATIVPTTITEPTSFTVTNNSPEWRQAMKEEYDALIKNGAWSLVPRASNTNVVDGKWVSKLKRDKNGAITHYKARFVAKVVLSLAVTNNWPLRQLDVQNTFLHGNLKEQVQRIENKAKTPSSVGLAASLEHLLRRSQVRGSLTEPIISAQYKVLEGDVASRDWLRGNVVAGNDECMSTHSSSTDLFPPSSDPESIIRNRQRNLGDQSLLLDFEEINMNLNNVQGPPPAGPPPQNHNGLPGPNFKNLAPDLRTMEELCQLTMNGQGRPIAPVNIQATDFGLKNHMIQQVQNNFQIHGLPGHNANKHIDKFLTITQSMKQNGVTNDALRLYLFPYSLTHHATAWNDISNFRQLPDESLFEAWERYKILIDRCPNHNMLPVTQIDTFYNGLTLRHRDTINAAAEGTFMKRGESSSSTTSSSSEIASLTQQMTEIRNDFLQMYRSNQQVNFVTPSCETCGGPHSYYECQAADGYNLDVYATMGNYNSGGNAY